MRTRSIAVAVFALLIAAAAAAVVWMTQTAFVRFALDRAVAASAGRLAYQDVQGSVFAGVRIARLAWRDPPSGTAPGDAGASGTTVEVTDLRVGWQPLSLLRGELDLTRVAARDVRVESGAGGESAGMPPSLALPIGVRIRDARIDTLRVRVGEDEVPELREVAIALRYWSGQFQVDQLQVASDHGRVSAFARMQDAAPYRLAASASLEEAWRGVAASAVLDGELARLQVQVAATGPSGDAPGAGADAERPAGLVSAGFALRPFEAQPLGPIALRIVDVDPAGLGVDLGVRMRWSGEANIDVAVPAGDQTLRVDGSARLANAQAGGLGETRLPLSTLSASFEWRDGALALSALRAELARGGRIEGDASFDWNRNVAMLGYAVPTPRLDLALADIDLGLLAPALGTTRLSGRARADGTRVTLDLADRSRAGAALSAAARVEGSVLAIERAALRAIPGLADAAIDAAGSVGLSAPYRVSLAGAFTRLDPSKLSAAIAQLARRRASPAQESPAWEEALARLPGAIDGRWALQTDFAASSARPIAVELDLTSGTLAGMPVRASVNARLEGDRVADSRLDLALGRTRIEARGALGAETDRLPFTLRAPVLAELSPLLGADGLSGGLEVKGELRGPLQAPSGTIAAKASALALPGRLRVAAAELDADVDAPTKSRSEPAVRLRAEARGIELGERRVRSADLALSGSPASHQFRAHVEAGRFGLNASGRAMVDGDRWRATLDELVSTGTLPARLREPARIEVAPGMLAVGPATVDGEFARVKLAHAAWRDGRFEIDGEAGIDRIAPLVALFAPPAAGANGANAANAANRANGASGVTGRASATDAAEADALKQLQRLGLDVRARLTGSSLADASGALALKLRPAVDVPADESLANGEADLAIAQGALSGKVDLRLPSLAFTERIVGPAWVFDGQLRFAGTVAGTLTQPRLDGELRGQSLRLEQREMGWRLGEGTLVARFDGEHLRVDALRLRSLAKGGGSVEMRGEVAVESFEGRFDFTADRLVVPIGPGQRVVLSGKAAASSVKGRFELSGSLRADEGRIELVGGDAPKLPEDVVIVDREATGAGQPPAATQRLHIAADLKLDLGNNLRVHGSGVNARLTGELSLKGTLPDAPRAYGTVRIRDGTYTAYGRDLEITRGRVVFNGPLDNPVLDIIALRREQPVEAGVALTGTVLSPRIRLTSRPDVPDAEKLSWLVLGEGLENAEGSAQMAALQVAAASLFGANDGGLSGGLRDTLGLDVLTVRSAGRDGGLRPSGFGDAAVVPGQVGTGAVAASAASATDNVVAIGKRLNSRLLLTYEQGLQGTWSVVRLQYNISRRLALRGHTGTETALDVLLRYPFD